MKLLPSAPDQDYAQPLPIDRVNGKPVRVYPYWIPRYNWRPTTELQNWMRSLNSQLQHYGLDLAFSDEQIKNSDTEIADIDTEFQLNAECAFREGLSAEKFLIQGFLGNNRDSQQITELEEQCAQLQQERDEALDELASAILELDYLKRRLGIQA